MLINKPYLLSVIGRGYGLFGLSPQRRYGLFTKGTEDGKTIFFERKYRENVTPTAVWKKNR